jgi:hypothetical protein
VEQSVDASVRHRLSEVIGALSHALDLTEGRPGGLTGEAIPLISRIALRDVSEERDQEI